MERQRRTTPAVLFGVAALSLALVLAAGQSQVSGQAGLKSLLKEIHDRHLVEVPRMQAHATPHLHLRQKPPATPYGRNPAR
jgi:hypothetical protein